MPAAAASRPRLAVIDLIRGVAVVAMIVYHLSWDLLDYGLIDVDVVNDPLLAESSPMLIAGTFLALVGFNLVLAKRNGIRPAAYFRRLAIIAGAAALVSLGTYWFMPDAFVFFGVLHMIAAASVLALPFLRAPVWATLGVERVHGTAGDLHVVFVPLVEQVGDRHLGICRYAVALALLDLGELGLGLLLGPGAAEPLAVLARLVLPADAVHELPGGVASLDDLAHWSASSIDQPAP